MPVKAINSKWLTQERVKRFWSYVDKSAGPSECWPWTRYLDKNGYGTFGGNIYGEPDIMYRSHRLAYYLSHNAEDPMEDLIIHSCDRPSCCNPSHLIRANISNNNQDTYNKGRNPLAVLTPDDVREIRKLRESGESPYNLSTKYGVSYQCIRRVCNRTAWRHII